MEEQNDFIFLRKGETIITESQLTAFKETVNNLDGLITYSPKQSSAFENEYNGNAKQSVLPIVLCGLFILMGVLLLLL